MDKGIVVVLAVLAVSYAFSRLKIYIEVQYQRRGENDDINVSVYVWRHIISYNINIPIIELSDTRKVIWLESELKTPKGDSKTHVDRELRYTKKTLRFYLNNPRRLWRFIKKVRKVTRLYNQIMQKFYNHLECEYFTWNTTVGTDDAALTGVLVGVLWSIKSIMVRSMSKRFIFKVTPFIDVVPVFNSAIIEVDFKCIFSIRVGNVISAGYNSMLISFRGG